MTVLTQSEAEALIELSKRAENKNLVNLPKMGGYVNVSLVSMDRREKFMLDISRGRIDLRKGTNQLRSNRHKGSILLRLDYHGPPHRNPDGSEIDCPHLHIYREGFADKWAYSLPDGVFSDLTDHWQILKDFMKHCSVDTLPNFCPQPDLFQ